MARAAALEEAEARYAAEQAEAVQAAIAEAEATAARTLSAAKEAAAVDSAAAVREAVKRAKQQGGETNEQNMAHSREEVARHKREVVELQEQLTRLKADLQTAQDSAVAAHRTHEQHSAELAQAHLDAQREREAGAKTARARAEAASEELDAERKRRADAEQQAREADGELQDAMKRLSTVDEERSALEHEHAAAVERLRTQLVQRAADVDRLSAERAQLDDAKRGAADELATLRTKLQAIDQTPLRQGDSAPGPSG